MSGGGRTSGGVVVATGLDRPSIRQRVVAAVNALSEGGLNDERGREALHG